MNTKPEQTKPDSTTIDEVMKCVSAIAQVMQLDSIRFADCAFSYLECTEEVETPVRIGVMDQKTTLVDEELRVVINFEFHTPSPFEEESSKRVDIRACVEVIYMANEDAEFDESDAEVFGRVNGIYNAWPYWREYVHTSLVRLGLPAFDLPLLRVGAAVHLAGLGESSDPVDD